MDIRTELNKLNKATLKDLVVRHDLHYYIRKTGSKAELVEGLARVYEHLKGIHIFAKPHKLQIMPRFSKQQKERAKRAREKKKAEAEKAKAEAEMQTRAKEKARSALSALVAKQKAEKEAKAKEKPYNAIESMLSMVMKRAKDLEKKYELDDEDIEDAKYLYKTQYRFDDEVGELTDKEIELAKDIYRRDFLSGSKELHDLERKMRKEEKAKAKAEAEMQTRAKEKARSALSALVAKQKAEKETQIEEEQENKKGTKLAQLTTKLMNKQNVNEVKQNLKDAIQSLLQHLKIPADTTEFKDGIITRLRSIRTFTEVLNRLELKKKEYEIIDAFINDDREKAHDIINSIVDMNNEIYNQLLEKSRKFLKGEDSMGRRYIKLENPMENESYHRQYWKDAYDTDRYIEETNKALDEILRYSRKDKKINAQLIRNRIVDSLLNNRNILHKHTNKQLPQEKELIAKYEKMMNDAKAKRIYEIGLKMADK